LKILNTTSIVNTNYPFHAIEQQSQLKRIRFVEKFRLNFRGYFGYFKVYKKVKIGLEKPDLIKN
jgi:hypothetical protein